MVSANTYQAARERAATIDRSERGRLLVTGADRAAYLQGLFTNDIAALTPGTGCYTAYLTAQGRMITDVFVYELGDVMMLTVPVPQKDTVLARLDQFVFSEDVQLADATESFFTIGVVGPEAAQVVARLVDAGTEELERLPEHGNRRLHFEGDAGLVTRITDGGEPGYDLSVASAQAVVLAARLSQLGIVGADAATADALRIEAGVPRFNRDMDEETIPLEAGIESRAISFTKGCYVGQEVIIRVLHRGHGRVARKLVGLVWNGDRAASTGTELKDGDRAIGRVTSSTWSPALNRPIALAYLHRDFSAEGSVVSLDGIPATVAPLPFVTPRG